jgi:hypothetical protein
MPIHSLANHKLQLVQTVCCDSISLTDVEDHHMTFWSDPVLFGYSELVDFSNADFSRIHYGDLLTITQQATKLYQHDPKSRMGIVCYTEEHLNIANFYISNQSMTTGRAREIRCFNNREQALNWLTESRLQTTSTTPALSSS